jgi:hypothetical protein
LAHPLLLSTAHKAAVGNPLTPGANVLELHDLATRQSGISSRMLPTRLSPWWA